MSEENYGIGAVRELPQIKLPFFIRKSWERSVDLFYAG